MSANFLTIIITSRAEKDLKIYYSTFLTDFGPCLVASTDKGICNVLLGETETALKADLKVRWPKVELIEVKIEADSDKNANHKQVQEYFKGIKPKSPISLHLHGTDFQIRVWKELLKIPKGQTSTYGEIAKSLGDWKMSRAVGTAIGDNPIGYIIPCHRVLKSTGEIGGYRWGIDRKRVMLACEGVTMRR